MTVHLYHSDPYMKDFSAEVVSINREWVALDRTAFYPGGGGQDPDMGTLNGLPVTEVKQDGDGVLHRVPGHNLTPGSKVRGEVEWGRRYDLMKGHSAEHLLFSRLQELCPEMELVKIAITPDKKSFMVKGALEWEMVIEAQRGALKAIADDLAITARTMARNDPELAETRIKMDRIHGDEVRVVSIGDIDKAACSGVHVRRTGELGMILVTKFTSARPKADFEVEFEVGGKAKHKALELAMAALRASESLGASPRDLLSALDNALRERMQQAEALRQYGRRALDQLTPSQVGTVKLYSGLFDNMDKKILLDAAAHFTEELAACVLSSAGESFMLVVACPPELGVNCVTVLNEALAPAGGRGGGKSNFAVGGAPSPQKADEVMVRAIDTMRKEIEANSKAH